MATIKQGTIASIGGSVQTGNGETIQSLGITVSNPTISKYVSFQIGTTIDDNLTYENSMHLGRSGIYEIDNLNEGIKFKVQAINPSTGSSDFDGTIYVDYVVN